ncbi:hypothetical protein T03_16671 [Trichinella britovi]|uniref:Uncharacterized protein n=1 Tax=Trichinella britovi TaxID=45882 RepID=A0A0V1C7V5_TRIBR|nr:hypothetical protein T03_16671 [Trichinella britovi]
MYVCDYVNGYSSIMKIKRLLNSKRLLRGCDYTGKLDQHPYGLHIMRNMKNDDNKKDNQDGKILRLPLVVASQ